MNVGDVETTEQVVGYLRRDEITHEVWDLNPLDLPERRMRTRSSASERSPSARKPSNNSKVSRNTDSSCATRSFHSPRAVDAVGVPFEAGRVFKIGGVQLKPRESPA